jgi:hypothetical protein
MQIEMGWDGYPLQQEAAPVSLERSAWIGGHATEP